MQVKKISLIIMEDIDIKKETDDLIKPRMVYFIYI